MERIHSSKADNTLVPERKDVICSALEPCAGTTARMCFSGGTYLPIFPPSPLSQLSFPQHQPFIQSPKMSSPTSPQTQNADEKPRLSEHEKKANHIASEQKRRQAIREGFDRLTELVPGLEGQGRSESVVLKKTVDFMREQLVERRRLVGRVEELGGAVEDELRK